MIQDKSMQVLVGFLFALYLSLIHNIDTAKSPDNGASYRQDMELSTLLCKMQAPVKASEEKSTNGLLIISELFIMITAAKLKFTLCFSCLILDLVVLLHPVRF